jgi:uncharacterized tellurite resistance protein B-like protein
MIGMLTVDIPLNTTITFALGKVLIAAAWSDGEIQHEETACLKDILFQLPELPRHLQKMLEMYMDAPVSPEEQQQMIQELLQMIQTDSERRFAAEALSRIIRADGVVYPAEIEFVDAIEKQLAEIDTGFMREMNSLVRTLSSSQETAKTDEITHALRRVMHDHFAETARATRDWDLGLPREELQKLCLAAILMAHIAGSDADIDPQEEAVIAQAIATHWQLNEQQAKCIADLALTGALARLDLIRVCRQFHEITTELERQQLIDTLNTIAMADGSFSEDEFGNIQLIANNLKLRG